ncbi:hypothetical protein LV716_05220 [Flagellimonas sp. HMM57]|uniref:lipocalin family protein n=1 Tax=unclassified Flagellimonas TaxID=2644544 RepID=UPI0013D73D14|nr:MULTISPECIES: lipocalin family protein [unclassified Flagellimonas]UII77172.1 hypothetical protein LV716_05220 [Flagellimonas sp. HMM57]
MKSKIFVSISFTLVFFLCLIGCSSDTAEGPSETKEISRELLIGTWTRDGADIVFNNDGTGESEVFDFDSGNNTLQFQPLTWRLDSNILTINFSVGTSIFQIIELDTDNMQLQDDNGVRRDYIKK